MNSPPTQINAVEDIPLELWSKIITSLEPHDVLYLGQTSRAIYEKISSRDTWIPVLRSACLKNALFMPSYPVEEMDVQQIKRAALGAYRWKHTMEKAHHDYLKPQSTTSFAGIGEDVNPFISQFLVPGGRFLFVANGGTLALWDLGPPGQPLLTSPIFIASVDLEGKILKRTRLAVTPSGGGCLRVAVLSENGDTPSRDTVDVVKVYEVNPALNESAFNELGSLQLLESPPPEELESIWERYRSPWEFHLRIHNDRLLIHVCGTSIVWDFAKGTYTSWNTSVRERPKTYLPPVIFTGDMVLEFMPNHLLGWIVPPLIDDLPQSVRLVRLMTIQAPVHFPHAGNMVTLQVPVLVAFSYNHGNLMTPPQTIPSHRIPYPLEAPSGTTLVWSLPSGWCSPQFPLLVDAVSVDQGRDGEAEPSLMTVSQCQLDVAFLSSAQVEGNLTLLTDFRVQTNANHWPIDCLFGSPSSNSSNILCQAIKNEGAWGVFAYAAGEGVPGSVVWLFHDLEPFLNYSLCTHSGRSVHSILRMPGGSPVFGASLEYVVSDFFSS